MQPITVSRSDSSDYQILILEKGGNNGNKHPEPKPQQEESLLPLVNNKSR